MLDDPHTALSSPKVGRICDSYWVTNLILKKDIFVDRTNIAGGIVHRISFLSFILKNLRYGGPQKLELHKS